MSAVLDHIGRPIGHVYVLGNTELHGSSSTATPAANKEALEAALLASDEVTVGPGTYDNLTISASNKRITFRHGVTIKLPDDTIDALDTTGPAVLGISGDNVTLIGDFTIDGNRANNDSSGFPGDARDGSLRISGDNCRIEGEVFVTGAYYDAITVDSGSNDAGNEVQGFHAQKIKVFDPAARAATLWTVVKLEITEIEVDIGTTAAYDARIRIGTQASSTGTASGHIGSVRTNGAFVPESCSDLHVDSVQCAAGKIQEAERVQIALWAADGSLMPSDAEGGPSFGMITCTDCHVAVVSVDGHYQTGTNPVAFTQGNIGCSVGAIRVNGTTSAVDDVLIGENIDLTIGAMKLVGTATGGDGLFYDHDADSKDIHIGVVHSTGHSNAGMVDVRLESNLGTNTEIIIGSINEDATLSIGTGYRKGSFSWTSGTASFAVSNVHCRSTSRVRVTPRDADAGVVIHSLGYYITPGAGSFTIFTGTGGNTAALSEWDYEIDNGL